MPLASSLRPAGPAYSHKFSDLITMAMCMAWCKGGKNEPPPSGDAFVCNNFTLSAPKQTLFDNVVAPACKTTLLFAFES